MRLNRRTLFDWAARGLAVVGLGGAADAGAPAAPGEGLVHYVNLDRRHIWARLLKEHPDGAADLVYALRPPVRLANGLLVQSEQTVTRVPLDPMVGRAGSWHRPYADPWGHPNHARRYAEWWYRGREPYDPHDPAAIAAVNPPPQMFLTQAEGARPPLHRPWPDPPVFIQEHEEKARGRPAHDQAGENNHGIG